MRLSWPVCSKPLAGPPPAPRSIHRCGLDAATYQQLDALLNDDTQTLLVGLLDDAAATLVLDLVRSAGGSVLSVEHHRIGAGSVDQQRASELGWAWWPAPRSLPATWTETATPRWHCAA